MNVNFIRCDYCGWEENQEITYGGHKHGWIEVKTFYGGTGHKLPTSISHYCDEKCLICILTKTEKS